MAQVFVSYKHEDISEGFIQHLRQKLEESGFDVWIDSELLLPGEDWKKEIDNAIKASIALIVIMTPEARKSEYVTYEWAFAAGREIPVIPVLLQKMELHPRLNDIQYVDFSNAWGDGVQVNWDKLITKLKLEVNKHEKRNEAKQIPPAIQRVMDELNNPNLDIRQRTLQSLNTMLPNEAAVEALCDAMNNHLYPDIRAGAASALGGLKSPELVPLFAARLKDTNPNVVQTVIFELQELNTEEAFQALLNAFDINANRHVEYSMLRAFGAFARPEAIPLLKQTLEKEEPSLFAVVALAQIGTLECKDIILTARDKFSSQIWGEIIREVNRLVLVLSEDFAIIFEKRP